MIEQEHQGTGLAGRPVMAKAKKRAGLQQGVSDVFLVDDHPIIRHGMAQLIDREQDLQVSGQAGGMAEALSAIKDADPDLVLVDQIGRAHV